MKQTFNTAQSAFTPTKVEYNIRDASGNISDKFITARSPVALVKYLQRKKYGFELTEGTKKRKWHPLFYK